MQYDLFTHINNASFINNDWRRENSREAEKLIDRQKLHILILKAMREINVPCTFREIARQLKLKDEQIWKRLNELEKDNKVTVTGKKKCQFSGRNVSLWGLK